jgi:hypothetical protein
MRSLRAAVAAMSVVAALGCGRLTRGEAAGVAAPGAVQELTVTFAQDEQVVTVKVAQVLRIVPPESAHRWQIDYASDILTVLTPPDELQRPSPVWRFRAIRAGETDVRVSGIVDAASPGAAPALPQFLVTIRVTP